MKKNIQFLMFYSLIFGKLVGNTVTTQFYPAPNQIVNDSFIMQTEAIVDSKISNNIAILSTDIVQNLILVTIITGGAQLNTNRFKITANNQLANANTLFYPLTRVFKGSELPTFAKAFEICSQGVIAVDAIENDVTKPYIIAFDRTNLKEKWQAKAFDEPSNSLAIKSDSQGNIFLLLKHQQENFLILAGFDSTGDPLPHFGDNGIVIISAVNYKINTLASMRILKDNIFVAFVESASTKDTVHLYKFNKQGMTIAENNFEFNQLSVIHKAKIAKSVTENIDITAHGVDSDDIQKLANLRLNIDLSIDFVYADNGQASILNVADSSDLQDNVADLFVHGIASNSQAVTLFGFDVFGDPDKNIAPNGILKLTDSNTQAAAINHDFVYGSDIIVGTQNAGTQDAKFVIYNIAYDTLKRSILSDDIYIKYCFRSFCNSN